MSTTKVYQIKNPPINTTYEISSENGPQIPSNKKFAGISHIGIQIPFSAPKRYISREQYRHKHNSDNIDEENKERNKKYYDDNGNKCSLFRSDYMPNDDVWGKGDISISYRVQTDNGPSSRKENFIISESCILEFDSLHGKGATVASLEITIIRELPKGTIIDIVYQYD